MNYAGKLGSIESDPDSGTHFKIDSLSHVGHGESQGDTITIPDAHLLFSGDYQRSGTDLIVSDQLHRVVVPNYFQGDKRPTLVSPEGAPLDSKVIEAMTGHVQYAQASGTAAAAKVVGHVVKETGSASIVRNGVTITLNNGDVVYQNDVVQTGSGSSVGLVMVDGTTFNLSANARLMLNDLTYDANSASNTSLFTLVQGAASFVAGQVAKTGDMKVGTPVASMGIRGTAVILDISATDGKVSISVIDQRDGQTHTVQVFNSRGVLIGTVTSNGSSLTLTPIANFEVIAQYSDKTPLQIQQEFQAFNEALRLYEIQKALDPNLPQHTDNANPQTKYAAVGSTPYYPSAPEYHSPAGSGSPLPGGTITQIDFTQPSPPPGGAGPTGSSSPPPDPIPLQVVVQSAQLPFVVNPSTVPQISPNPGDHFGPVMSASGDVVYDPDGIIYFYDRESGTTIRVTPDDGFSYGAQTISSNGRYIVYQGTDGTDTFVYVYGTDPSDPAHYHQQIQLVAGTSPAISGDGSTILVEHGGSSIGIYNLQGDLVGSITAAAAGATGTVWKPAISADGHVIAFWTSDGAAAGGAGHLFTYDVTTGAVTEIASTTTGAGNSAASFSADGRYVVYESNAPGGHSEVYLYDLSTGEVIFHTENTAGRSYSPVISPDGHFIVFASKAQLTSGDTNAFADIYRVDVSNPHNPIYKLISVRPDGTSGDADSDLGAAISADGIVVFGTKASNFSNDSDNGEGDIFISDPSSGRNAIIYETANSPSTLHAQGVIELTGDRSGALGISVTDQNGNPTSLFSASLNAAGNIEWKFDQAKSAGAIAALQYGQDLSQGFIIRLTAGGDTITIPVTVTIHDGVQPAVVAVGAAPGAAPVTLAPGIEDQSFTITRAALLAGVGDIDTPLASLSFTNVSVQSGGGSLVNNGNGTWTYTPATNFNGTVVFSYTVSDGSKTASSTASLVIAGVNDAPTGAVTIDGIVRQGEVLTANVSTLADADGLGTIHFQWQRDGVNISGANSATYTLGSADVGHTVDVVASYTDGRGTAESLTSAPTTQVAGPGIIVGSNNGETLDGTSGNDVFQGFGGNDTINGKAGRDFAVYTDAAAAITVDLASGVVHGTAPGDLAEIGTDTLRSIEYIRGSHFGDTFVATGFGTTSANAGSITSGSVNNGFEGMGGNDVITGNGGTQLWYRYAAAGVTVDFKGAPTHGTAQSTVGDAAGIGHDTFTGVNAVRGSEFGDTLLGSDNTTRTDVFYGGAGNDFIDGRGGYDLVVYAAAIGDTVTGGVTMNLAAGTVVGNSSVGSDTLRGVELVRGTNFADSFTAVGFNGSSTNAGSFGTFNDFEGMDGNDSITGNGNTRVSYSNATAAVIVDLGAGTARDRADAANGTTADLASVGVDTFHGGINSVRGSDFNDRLFGSNNSNIFSVEHFLGGKGDDFIDGRGGLDRAQYSTTSDDPYTGGITVQLAAGTVTGDASVGTDTLRSVEFIRATNFNDIYNATGFSGSSANAGSSGTFNEFEGMDGNDVVTGNGNTRIVFYNATAAVTVDLADNSTGGTGTARDSADAQNGTLADLASIGIDTFHGGVNAVAGSQFNDTIRGSNNPQGTAEQLEGRGGNDFLDGRGGFDVAVYYIDQSVGSGIDVDMAAGTVEGDTAIGLDTLRGIESVTGTRFEDHYSAIGFGGQYYLNPLTHNVGSFGSFNEFQGYGGNDTIQGNGNTRVSYANASAGVFVDLDSDFGVGTAHSLVGDLAQIGVDTITGANSVRGSAFGDEIYGSSGFSSAPADNILDGQGGNDLLDGRGGDDQLIGGSGADTFVYADGYGTTTIADFKHSENDKIDLTGVSDVHSLDDLNISECEGDTVIHFGDGHSLTLTGVVADDLVAGDFVFSPATNHPATFGGDFTGSLIEDETINASGNVIALDFEDGTLTVQDPDSGEDHFQAVPQASLTGTYGNFTINENTGYWTYTLSHDKANGLAADQHVQDKLTVASVDGTTQDITVNITGTNDAPEFSGQNLAPTYASGGGAVSLAAAVSVSDIDNVNYNGGTITATITDGRHEGDILSIADSQYVSVSGTTVWFDADGDGNSADPVAIGTISDDLNSLSIDLNSNATDAAIVWLTQAIQFLNTKPNPEAGTRTVTFTLNDGAGAADGGHDSDFFTATVNVTGSNHAPVAVDDTNSGYEDATITGTLASNDSDVDDGETATLNYVQTSAVAGLTINADGSYSFDAGDAAYQYLADGVTADVVASYTVTDIHGAEATGNLTITLTGTNDAPVAVEDTNSGYEDATVSGTVASNDSDVDDGETATLNYVQTSAVAGLMINADGSYSFDAGDAAYQYLADGVTADVVASYTVTDVHGAQSAGSLTITLTGTNNAPVAVEDTNSGYEDATITGTLASNDSDVDDGETATLIYAQTSALAGLTINEDGSYSFDAGDTAYQYLAAGATTDVVASYTVTDIHGAESTGSLTITLTGTNDAPVFTGFDLEQTYVASGGAVALVDDVLASDIDSADYDGGSLTAAVTGGMHAGDMLWIANDGVITVESGGIVMFDIDGAGDEQAVAIGTRSGGGSSLTVTLNASADDAAVQALTEAIRFETWDSTQVDRTVTFTLDDGGVASTSFDATVHFGSPPPPDQPPEVDVGTSSLVYTFGLSGTLALAPDLFVSDDSNTINGATVTFGNYDSNFDEIDFSTFSTGISFGFDTGTGILTLSGSASAADYQSVLNSITFYNSNPETPVSSRQIDFVVTDNNNQESAVSSVTLELNHAPVIVTDNLQLSHNGATTTVGGLSVSDTDAGLDESFTITAVTQAAGSGSTVAPPMDSGTLAGINGTLGAGITYDPGSSPPLTDMVTVTVTDGFGGTDTVNFIFNEAHTGPITLQGTDGKDVIFATGDTDTLTGGAGADQFVFSGGTGHDTITDFKPGQDRIDLLDDLPFDPGSPSSFNAWINNNGAVEDLGNGSTQIHLEGGNSILLSNVSRASLHINDFILHPGSA